MSDVAAANFGQMTHITPDTAVSPEFEAATYAELVRDASRWAFVRELRLLAICTLWCKNYRGPGSPDRAKAFEEAIDAAMKEKP